MKNLMPRFLSKSALVAGAVLSVATAASADTLDFSGLSQGYQNTTTLVLSNATITSFGQNLYVGAAGIGKEICAINNGNCQADMGITFNSVISGLTFVTSGFDTGDMINVSAYNGATFLGSVAHASNGLVNMAAFSNVTRIYIDDSSTGAGFAYDQFNFNVTAVPEPETYALMLAGLGLLGAVARRRKAKQAA